MKRRKDMKMDVATQIVFILFFVLVTAAGFGIVGKDPSEYDRDATNRKGFAFLTFLYAVFTIAFLLWWEPATAAESAARWATIGLLWVPLLFDVREINRKPKMPTLTDALTSAALNATRVGLVLGFWVLA
jgi:hypothetical protein